MSSRKTSWGQVAGWYNQLLEESEDSYQKNVILPNLIRVLDPKPEMRIMDMACGQGYFCRAFHEKGARVAGCDISKELIEIARKNSDKKIDYFIASAENLGDIHVVNGSSSELDLNGRFDAVTIVLALQNIEGFGRAILESSRILKMAGRLIMVLNHPAFRIPKHSSWGWDDRTNRQYRRVDAYLSDITLKIDMTPGESKIDDKRYTFSFHRPLQSYFKALSKSGFAVTRLEEWISHKKSRMEGRGQEENDMRKEIPMFVCLEAEKVRQPRLESRIPSVRPA